MELIMIIVILVLFIVIVWLMSKKNELIRAQHDYRRARSGLKTVLIGQKNKIDKLINLGEAEGLENIDYKRLEGFYQSQNDIRTLMYYNEQISTLNDEIKQFINNDKKFAGTQIVNLFTIGTELYEANIIEAAAKYNESVEYYNNLIKQTPHSMKKEKLTERQLWQ